MGLSKRERVIRTLELEEPDKVPIHSLGFEKSCTAYQAFVDSAEFEGNRLVIKNSFSRSKNSHAGDITEQRFWNVDTWIMDPFSKSIFYGKLDNYATNNVPEHPGCVLEVISGRVLKFIPRENTGINHMWYVGPYFKTPEVVARIWDEFGPPSEHINDRINYSPQVWNEYVESLSPYLYPMAQLDCFLHESLIEGMGFDRVAFYMRKQPTFLHYLLEEYTKVNVEIIKRLSEAGVDIIFYFDDLGQKDRSILGLPKFREFILPYYKRIYGECRKRGMLVVQHSCGFIEDFLPDMANAGLNCIQTLEPAAGVDLGRLKNALGDRLAFMGGMDSSRILTFGTAEEIGAEVKRCILVAGKGGGYFAGPSHNILDVPWKNVLAFRDAIEKYRHYPLSD